MQRETLPERISVVLVLQSSGTNSSVHQGQIPPTDIEARGETVKVTRRALQGR